MDNRVLMGAIEEMNEKGLRFTMSHLAKRLNVSKRTLYESYPSKDILIRAVVDATIQHIEMQDATIMDCKPFSIIEKIEELLNYQYKSDLHLTKSFFIELQYLYPSEWEKFLHFRKRKLDTLDTLFHEGVEKGIFRNVHRNILQMMIHSSVNAFFEQKNLSDLDMTYKQAISIMGDILFYGIVKR